MQTGKFSSFTSIATLLLLSAAAIPALGQNSGVVVGGTRITHTVDDWSHHRVTFTNPGTADEAIKNGTYSNWLKVVNEPRYVLQQLKKGAPVQGPAAADVAYLYAHGHSGQSNSNSKGKTVSTALDKDWSMSLGATGTLLINQYPAKFTFDTTNPGGCNDFVVYPTGIAGASNQATIVAYTSIYGHTTCPSGPSNGGPLVDWAYSITGVTSALSPTISLDGTQVAFIGTSGGVASLILLTPATGGTDTVTTPTVLTPITAANASTYPTCNAPCALSLPFNNGKTDTNSAPFYVYYGTAADAIFVGDDSGNLHKFTGVFNGTPAETIAGGWPVALGTTKVTSPVLDPVTNLVFAGDAGGILYSVVSTGTPTKVTSARTAFNTAGIVDSPIVDVNGAASDVYVSVGCHTTCGTGSNGAVVQYSTASSIATQTPVVATLGSDAVATDVYDGAFDNTHENGTATSGNMYVCGYHSTGTQPELFQIPMNSFTGAASVIDTTIANGTGTCGPMTEFLSSKTPTTLVVAGGGNLSAGATSLTVAAVGTIATGDYIQIGTEAMLVGTIAGTTVNVTRGRLGTTGVTHANGSVITDDPDWLYVSLTAGGSEAVCTGACLYNYIIGNGSESLTAAPTVIATAGIAATLGTTGIIIDNASTTTGEEQIYYSTLGNLACVGNGSTGTGTQRCAVQTSQAAP